MIFLRCSKSSPHAFVRARRHRRVIYGLIMSDKPYPVSVLLKMTEIDVATTDTVYKVADSRSDLLTPVRLVQPLPES